MSVDKSSILIMKISGYLFFSVGIIASILQLLNFIGIFGSFVSVMSIITTSILALALLFLGITMMTLGRYTAEAKVASVLLFVYLVLDILSVALTLFDQVLAIVALVFSFLIRIYTFNMVNKTFKILDPSLQSPLFQIYGWFGVISLTSVILLISSTNWGLNLFFTIFVILGNIGLLIGMGLNLLDNSKNIPDLPLRALEEKLPFRDRLRLYILGGAFGTAIGFGYVLAAVGVTMGLLYIIMLIHQLIVGI